MTKIKRLAGAILMLAVVVGSIALEGQPDPVEVVEMGR